MQENAFNIAHIRILVTVNRKDFAWTDPQVQNDVELTIPVELLHMPNLSKVIEKTINKTVADFEKLLSEKEKE